MYKNELEMTVIKCRDSFAKIQMTFPNYVDIILCLHS
jgi:hypothetical protein